MIKVNGRAKYTEEDLGFICFYKATDKQSKIYLRLQKLRRLRRIGICFLLLIAPLIIEFIISQIIVSNILLVYLSVVSLILFSEINLFMKEKKLWKHGKVYYHDCEIVEKDGLEGDLSTKIHRGTLLYKVIGRDKDTGYKSTIYLPYHDFKESRGTSIRCWYVFDTTDELPILFS